MICALSVQSLASNATVIYRAHPDVQEKIRRCVSQAHIDPEDFKGVRLLAHLKLALRALECITYRNLRH